MAYNLVNLAGLTTFSEDLAKVYATKAELEAAKAAALKGLKVNGTNVAAVDGVVNITAETGTANGTVKVAGQEVAVAGLKAMAYKDAVDETALPAALKTDISNLKTDMTTLKGDATVEGSVKHAAAAAVTQVVGGASADFDTLKEMEDWLSSHESDAAGMNTAIQGNAADITKAFAQLGVAKTADAPETGKTVVERLSTLETGLANVGDTLEGYVKTSDIVLVTDEQIHALLGVTPEAG